MVSEIYSQNRFSIEKYQATYTKMILTIQVALGIIAISGIVLVVLPSYGAIEHTFVYIGTGGASVSIIASLGLFIFGKKNNFRDALGDLHTVADFKLVCQNLEFHELCFCHPVVLIGEGRYLNVSSDRLSGTVSHFELKDKIKSLKSDSLNKDDETYLNELQTTIENSFYGHRQKNG